MSHCKDCCCARSWEALGITEYTGLSIPEHIERLTTERDEARKEVAALRALLRRIVRMIQTKEKPLGFIDSILCEWDGVEVTDDGDFVLPTTPKDGEESRDAN